MRVHCCVAALLGVLTSRAPAQIIRGTVVDERGAAVSGVVVQLTDSASRAVARALSDERGNYRLAAPSGGMYRVSTLRIGFRPVTSSSFSIGTGQEREERVTLSSVRVALDTMRVISKSSCRITADSASATFAVWEQARGALAATALTGKSRNIEATVVGYQRTLEPDGRRIRQQETTIRSAYVNEPWLSPSPEKLREAGYVVTQRDGSIVYYAPSIDALLSPAFVEDHCFQLTTDRKHRDMVGIAFEPTKERKPSEIQGTLWLDRATSELRSAEFKYANIPSVQADFSGGEMTLARFASGGWAITSWQIRMPAIENVIVPGHGNELRVAEIQVAGGELALARRGRDTLWSRPPLTVAGVVRDSISGKTIEGARVAIKGTAIVGETDGRGRFELKGVLPGDYTLVTTTPSLDSVASVQLTAATVTDASKPVEVRTANATLIAERICGGSRASPGMIVGSVSLRSDSTRPAGVALLAEANGRALRTRTDSLGRFRFCDVPVNAPVVVHAEWNPNAGSANARIPDGGRIAKADLILSALPQPGAVIAGVVANDSTKQPIAGAEVSFPELGKATLTDARGAFRLEGLAPGNQQLTVRRIGFGPVDTRVDLTADQPIERDIFLARSVTLDSVRVVAKASERLRESFEEHRKLGLGKFYTRADFEARGITHIADLMQMTNGAAVLRGRGGSAWLVPRRGLSGRGQRLEQTDIDAGAPRDGRCYSIVWLDGARVYSGKDFEPLFNLNSIPIEQIEAVEFYASMAEAPTRYAQPSPVCNGGVFVIWTRR